MHRQKARENTALTASSLQDDIQCDIWHQIESYGFRGDLEPVYNASLLSSAAYTTPSPWWMHYGALASQRLLRHAPPLLHH